jgi:hypothetical protein
LSLRWSKEKLKRPDWFVEGAVGPAVADASEGPLDVVVGDVQPDASIVAINLAAIIPTICFMFIRITLDEVS